MDMANGDNYKGLAERIETCHNDSALRVRYVNCIAIKCQLCRRDCFCLVERIETCHNDSTLRVRCVNGIVIECQL